MALASWPNIIPAVGGIIASAQSAYRRPFLIGDVVIGNSSPADAYSRDGPTCRYYEKAYAPLVVVELCHRARGRLFGD